MLDFQLRISSSNRTLKTLCRNQFDLFYSPPEGKKKTMWLRGGHRGPHKHIAGLVLSPASERCVGPL